MQQKARKALSIPPKLVQGLGIWVTRNLSMLDFILSGK